MTQNGSNIDFIDDIYFALFACMFRMTADYYSVYQFVAHLAGKFRRFEILLDVSYKVIGTLYRIRCFSQSLFKFRDLVFQIAYEYFGLFHCNKFRHYRYIVRRYLLRKDFEISCYFLLFHFLTPLELDLPFSGNRRRCIGR